MAAFLSIFGVILVADQVTKIIVRSRMDIGTEIPLLPFFSLTHVDNTGIAFGLFQERNVFFIALGIGVTLMLAMYGLQLLHRDRPSALGIAAILGGAVGNIIDRIAFGRVTDFIDLYVSIHHWPVFNIADSAICVGAAFVAVRGLIEWRSAGRRRQA